jgi:hypothetical protein
MYKKPTIKESVIQRAVEDYLALLEKMDKLVYVKNNSGAFKAAHGSFVRFGKVGSPDFFVFLPNGVCLHLEVKNEKGKQNDNQREYEKMITRLGHEYLIIRDLDDLIHLLEGYKESR